jgi:hypothetical protein
VGALPKKKNAVVAIDAARRRRRQPNGPEKPKPPPLNMVAFALALVVAAAATIFGLKIVLELVKGGDYVRAAVAPFWVIVPGCAPLLFLIIRRRRTARATPSKVTPLKDSRLRNTPPRRRDS